MATTLVRSAVRPFVVVLALAATACVRVSATQLEPGHASVAPDSVRVYVTRTPEAYTEIAVLRTHRFLVSDAKVLDALRRRAARLGADGILLLNPRTVGSSTTSGSGVVIRADAEPAVVVGSSETKVDEFERAVAIRAAAPPKPR